MTSLRMRVVEAGARAMTVPEVLRWVQDRPGSAHIALTHELANRNRITLIRALSD